ncbi:ankyrin repeat-containing domain protein [Xylaria palmicola]|nr:ankyrin repeat-containing domain protein [Xylaria palmicola]
MNTRRDNIDDAHPNTCKWLFNTDDFEKWREGRELSTHNGVLWIKGKPGSGKSTLMSHLLSFCERSFGRHRVISYFFNARGGVLEKTPLGMMRSIVCQLLNKDDAIYRTFIDVYRQKQRGYNGSVVQWQQPELKKFVLSIAKQQHSEPLLLLVDALDECVETEARDIVGFLETMSLNAAKTGTELRICLSSRHYPQISMKWKLELVVETRDEHGEDIATYVLEKLYVPDRSIAWQIQKKAGGVFMWVVLVVAMLNKAYDEGRPEAMQEKLDKTPKDLEGIFDLLLEKEGSEKAELIRMLQWTLFSQVRLSPEQLCIASADGRLPSRDAEIIRRRIVHSSRGLIEVRKGRDGEYVQFIHLSVSDFLYRNRRLVTLDPTLQPFPIMASHARLWDRCWLWIKSYDNNTPILDHGTELLSESCPFLQYARSNILYHADVALSTNNNIVRWLESRRDWVDLLDYSQPPMEPGFHRDSAFEALKDTCETLLVSCLAADYRHLFDFLLERGADIDAVLSNGSTLLQMVSASSDNYVAVVQFLLEKGANINTQGGKYGNALQAACSWGHIKIAELLIKNGANINAQGGYYGNALQAACFQGYTKIVKLLIGNSANINAQGGYYRNALQAACFQGYTKIVKLLIGNGANINMQGGKYGNALQAACYRERIEIAELLIKNGANVNAQGGYYRNALQAACSWGDIEIAELLIRNGANVNAQGGYYRNALQAACYREHIKIAELLIKNGANINAQGGYYGNALQAACFQGYTKIVELLIGNGANVNAQGGKYGNALRAAWNAWENSDELVKLLIARGAEDQPDPRSEDDTHSP